jgi:hypothetical protein
MLSMRPRLDDDVTNVFFRPDSNFRGSAPALPPKSTAASRFDPCHRGSMACTRRIKAVSGAVRARDAH